MELQLFETFVKDVGLSNEIEELFNDLYPFVVVDFDRELEDNVFLVAFGREISVSAEEFYWFDQDLAKEEWGGFAFTWISDYILDEGYKSDCDESIIEKIDTLIHRFIEWLRALDHDKLDVELVTKLLVGEANERTIALRGLDAYLTTQFYWPYPKKGERKWN